MRTTLPLPRGWNRRATSPCRCRVSCRSQALTGPTTLEWVDWFNNRRLFKPIGNIPPVELEEAYYRNQELRRMCPESRGLWRSLLGCVLTIA